MSKRNFSRALGALAIATIGTAASAAGPAECGLIGTWAGYAGGSLVWTATHTPGSTIAKGQMAMDFVYLASWLAQGAARLTTGHGAWEQVNRGQYKYSWFAYGVAADGQILYTLRVTGVAANNGCNRVDIDYLYEVFSGWVFPPQNVNPESVDNPRVYYTEGKANEFRVPVPVTEQLE